MTRKKKMAIIISTCIIMAVLILIFANAIYCSYFPKWEGQTNDKNWSASIKYYPFDKFYEGNAYWMGNPNEKSRSSLFLCVNSP
ncbi:DUF4944 domain-containing protein [Terrilactibacillus sp. S3-3]|nr:DUF4944 domain-containing protein [Terrilactibacillus sp. S3-3]